MVIIFSYLHEQKLKQGGYKMDLSQQKKLIGIAKKSIAFFLQHQTIPTPKDLNEEDLFPEQRATFVTLYKKRRLRGCIGEIFAQTSITKSIIKNSIQSAFYDPRFSSLSQDELEEITIEISVLSPIQDISSYEQIRIGTDGIVMRKDGKSAVFLPHVPTDFGWDLQQTLEQLSSKAGMKKDGWKSGASFQIFQSQKIT
jgi:AmmeMemoRadiSam system protein A